MKNLRNLKFNVLGEVKEDWRVKLNLLAYKKLQKKIEYKMLWCGYFNSTFENQHLPSQQNQSRSDS